jgi:hypothetical protein
MGPATLWGRGEVGINKPSDPMKYEEGDYSKKEIVFLIFDFSADVHRT